jgi:ATP-dependent Clp protease ATP-binding subunit ClpX
MEEIMLDIMYEIPSQPEIIECVVDENVVTKKKSPMLLYEKKEVKTA